MEQKTSKIDRFYAYFSRAYLSFLKRFCRKKYLLMQRKEEKKLLIFQLKRSISTNVRYRNLVARRGQKHLDFTPQIEQQKLFLNDIESSTLDDFETVASSWIAKLGCVK